MSGLRVRSVGITVSLTQMAWISALAWAIVAAGTAAGLIRLQHRHAGNTRARKAARTRRQHRATRKEQSHLKDPATHPPRGRRPTVQEFPLLRATEPVASVVGRATLRRGALRPGLVCCIHLCGFIFHCCRRGSWGIGRPEFPLPIHVLNAPKRAIHLPQFDTPNGFLQGRVLRCALRRTVVEK